MKNYWSLAAAVCLCAACGRTGPPLTEVRAVLGTEQVSDDPDDPAIWIHPSDAARSLIIGTNKTKAPSGALVLFGLDGKTRQTVAGLDRPNNVDVEYGLAVGGENVDIAVAAERLKGQLRIFRVTEEGLTDLTSPGNTAVFTDRTGEQAAPMGVSLYKRPTDSAVFAIVAPKNGPREGYLGQYRLQDDGKGKVKAVFLRYFGRFSGTGEIEAVAVDDALGFVYYADEGDGIHKYSADPDQPASEAAHFGREGFRGDREGIAIYARPDGKGYVVCTDQLEGSSEYHFYRREDPRQEVKVIRGGADSTDGLEITPRPLGPAFPSGLMVAMNSKGRNFLLFRWEDVSNAVEARQR